MKNKIKYLVFLFLIILCVGCSNDNNKDIDLLGIDFDTNKNEILLEKYETDNPIVAMKIKNYGAIVIELYPNKAPNTVNNFISLVKDGFYDNNTFHRLVPGFVLQGGDPTGTGAGGPGYAIKGEFKNNNYSNNDLKHEEKIVSMARSSDNDSAGSQFFIMLGKAQYLDGDYAAFGKVIDGYDIIKNIEEEEIVEDESSGKLRNNLIIEKVLIDTKGKNYEEVEKIKKD